MTDTPLSHLKRIPWKRPFAFPILKIYVTLFALDQKIAETFAEKVLKTAASP
jgi:hypothetical protein